MTPLNRTCALLLCGFLLTFGASAQRSSWRSPTLPRDRAKSGTLLLEAFAPIVAEVRGSVVRLQLDNEDAVLGAVVDPEGLILTKASEVSGGKLACILSDGRKFEAHLVATDDESDLALVRIHATGLKPVKWDLTAPVTGEWAVTPGVGSLPEAVGIVSVPPRRILPKRAVIGVLPDFTATSARVSQVMPGFGAEKAGMKPGDVIVAVNDVPVKDGEELVTVLRNYREGQIVKLRVSRDGDKLELPVPMVVPSPERLGRQFGRQERMNRLGGELSRRAEGFEMAVQHDTVLKPSQCGGPLVNLEGKVIGLNIARAGRVASYALPAGLVKEAVERLRGSARDG